MLGGKGANQAVGLAQLGTPVALVGVVGDDRTGHELLDHATRDGIDITHTVRREHTPTALLVDILDDHPWHRYLEHIPPDVLLTERDVFAASELIRRADTIVIQLQQPLTAALEAAHLAHATHTRIVLDGATDNHTPAHADLLARTDVLRADAHEAELLASRCLNSITDTAEAAQQLRKQGPTVVVLEVADEGNLISSPAGYEFLPHDDAEVLDTTGAGDALVATLVHSLVQGDPLSTAARLAVTAAGITTEHAGGRPRLHNLATKGTPP